mgnify:CR=1 FL=1
MKRVPLNKVVLTSRLEEIRRCLDELEKFKKISLDEFKKGYNFAICEHFLRRALEAVFDIGSHILSRIPGARAGTYKEIAILLGKEGILPQSFVEDNLVKMAGYRNRLVHFYYEIKEKELYFILQNDLKDIEKFCFYIAEILKNPAKWNLQVE